MMAYELHMLFFLFIFDAITLFFITSYFVPGFLTMSHGMKRLLSCSRINDFLVIYRPHHDLGARYVKYLYFINRFTIVVSHVLSSFALNDLLLFAESRCYFAFED